MIREKNEERKDEIRLSHRETESQERCSIQNHYKNYIRKIQTGKVFNKQIRVQIRNHYTNYRNHYTNYNNKELRKVFNKQIRVQIKIH